MKNLILILLLSFSFSSCATTVTDNDLDDIVSDFSHLNSRVLAKLRRSKSLHDLNSDKYKILIEKHKKDSEKEFIEFFNKFTPESAIKISEKDFGICIKSVQARVFVCDDAFTGSKVETSKDSRRDIQKDVKTELKKLILIR